MRACGWGGAKQQSMEWIQWIRWIRWTPGWVPFLFQIPNNLHYLVTQVVLQYSAFGRFHENSNFCKLFEQLSSRNAHESRHSTRSYHEKVERTHQATTLRPWGDFGVSEKLWESSGTPLHTLEHRIVCNKAKLLIKVPPAKKIQL